MGRAMKKRLSLTCLVVAIFAASASAHRLDEYLQATRIGIERGRVELEIDLTPGAAVAPGIIQTIDRDQDGTLSSEEKTEYAATVIRLLSLAMDGDSLTLALSDSSFPAIDEMQRGEGVIRLRARALAENVSEGRHRIHFKNNHRAEIAAYLVNAFMPTDERIHITAQLRDTIQREVAVDYFVSKNPSNTRLASALPLIFGLAITATILMVLRRW